MRHLSGHIKVKQDWIDDFNSFCSALGVPNNATRMELSKSWSDDRDGPGILRITTADDESLEIEVDHDLVERIADAIGATASAASFTLTHDWGSFSLPVVTISYWAMPSGMAKLLQATQEQLA